MNSIVTAFSDSPCHLPNKFAAVTLKNVVPHSLATAFANSVLPVPGGPYNKMPCPCSPVNIHVKLLYLTVVQFQIFCFIGIIVRLRFTCHCHILLCIWLLIYLLILSDTDIYKTTLHEQQISTVGSVATICSFSSFLFWLMACNSTCLLLVFHLIRELSLQG